MIIDRITEFLNEADSSAEKRKYLISKKNSIRDSLESLYTQHRYGAASREKYMIAKSQADKQIKEIDRQLQELRK